MFSEHLVIRKLTEDDFPAIKRLEKMIYPPRLVLGDEMVNDIKNYGGLPYSFVLIGQLQSLIGYVIAIKTSDQEGNQLEYLKGCAVIPDMYLEDISISKYFQKRGFGWFLLKRLFRELKEAARREGKDILLGAHFRRNSARLVEKHFSDLELMGVAAEEKVFLPCYYADSKEDATYEVFRIKAN